MFRAPTDKAALATYRDAGIDSVLLEMPDLSRDEILREVDKLAPLVKVDDVMGVAVGLGLMEFPFADARGYLALGGPVRGRRRQLASGRPTASSAAQPILECMTAMAALAGRTRRIKFGMNVVSLALRDPVLVAKQCATIDVLSEGRLLPAFGIGSPHGAGMDGAATSTRRRAAARPTRASRSSRACGARTASISTGQHYTLSGASISPKPVQPDLPMWIGGSSDAAVRRTARYGTGWQAGPETPAEAARMVAAIRAADARPAAASTTTTTAPASPSTSAARGASAAARDGGLRRAHGPRSARLFRGRRRRGHHGAHRRVYRRRRLQVRAAAGRAGDEAVLAQTRRLIEEVLPRVAARWPRVGKATTSPLPVLHGERVEGVEGADPCSEYAAAPHVMAKPCSA